MPSSHSRAVTRRPRKTRFVDIFRTTPAGTVCPNFYVLSHANGCAFDPQCAYCYLKSSLWYLREQMVFTNTQAMLEEIRAWIHRDGLESYVLNMGNLSDSLVFEDVRPVTARLVELFRTEAAARPHSLLLVTKGGVDETAPLREVEPCANVIVSFSINNPEAAREHEAGAAPVEDRMEAAAVLGRRGWRIRIRMDPMMDGYSYLRIAREVRLLRPERVTLGCLRAEAGLLKVGDRGLFSGLKEPLPGDGLARYPLEVRLRLYREARAGLGRAIPVGLCEERREVWDRLRLDADAKCCNCGL
jgi:DNA repair photolyase